MNNVLGIGTDIVYIPRITGLLTRNHVIGNNRKLKMITNKFMTEFEQNRFFKLLDKSDEVNTTLINYTAGIWATKESLLKALSCYVPKDDLPAAQAVYSKLFTKFNDPSGAPLIRIEKNSCKSDPSYHEFYNKYINDKIKILLSVSHDQDYLVSYCLIQSNDKLNA